MSSTLGDEEYCFIDAGMNLLDMVHIGIGAGVMSGCDEWSWTQAHVTLCK